MNYRLHASYRLTICWTIVLGIYFHGILGGCWNNQIILRCKLGPHWSGILLYMYCVLDIYCMKFCAWTVSFCSSVDLYHITIWWLESEHKFTSCISLFSLPSLNSMTHKHLSSLRPGTCLQRNWTSARYRFCGTQLLCQRVMYTYLRSIFSPLQIKDAFISDGCLLSECTIKHSVIGVCSRLSSGCELMVHTSPRCMLMFYTCFCIRTLIWATRVIAATMYNLVYHFQHQGSQNHK
jgi:hypothetical protein